MLNELTKDFAVNRHYIEYPEEAKILEQTYTKEELYNKFCKHLNLMKDVVRFIYHEDPRIFGRLQGRSPSFNELFDEAFELERKLHNDKAG